MFDLEACDRFTQHMFYKTFDQFKLYIRQNALKNSGQL